jgi:acetolactate synthase-1/2/3 large subunit
MHTLADCPSPLHCTRNDRISQFAVGDFATGANLFWQTLLGEGVDVVFGYPGGMILPVYDALPGYPIRHVLVRHEQNAAHMADGYARASGKVGVALTTSGPGATNLVTGIANAMMDSIPLVCVTGQVPSGLLGTDAFQESDISGITIPITKHGFVVRSAEEVVPTLRQAFELARSGRPGPVLVDITKDAQTGRAAFAWPDPKRVGVEAPLPSDAAIESILELIACAERPLILAGHGVVRSGSGPLLAALAERSGIPVACTLLGLSALPGGHPMNLGMMGMHGHASTNRAVQRADLVIALGMRFDDRATGDVSKFAPRARKIHVDVDACEIGKNVRVDVALVADVRAVLERLVRRSRSEERIDWWSEIGRNRCEAPTSCRKALRDDDRLLGTDVLAAIWTATRGEATVVTDVGQHQMWTAQQRTAGRGRFITSGGHGTMGFALPAAIGVRLASPGDEIWVIVGDGGFQMAASELSTLAEERIKLNIAVMNNGGLGMVRQIQELFYGCRRVASSLRGPDFVTLAAAHGIGAVRVDKRCDVEAAIRQARRSRESLVVDFRIAAEQLVIPTVPAGAGLGEMLEGPASEWVEPHRVDAGRRSAEFGGEA